jgi:hypothetical protein
MARVQFYSRLATLIGLETTRASSETPELPETPAATARGCSRKTSTLRQLERKISQLSSGASSLR